MKIGILGSGFIAGKMAETINLMNRDDVELYAIGASSLEKAEAFAEKYNIKKFYGDYESLAKDNDIDLIYIATIHTMHYEHAILCIKNGKNILVEKPFTVNYSQAKEVFDIAKEYNVFVSEAMWTRFMPSADFFAGLEQSGIIGSLESLTANIGYNIRDVKRINSPECAGGALLDIGIYPIHLAMMLFGNDIEDIFGKCTYLESGVDAVDSIIMNWKSGKSATLQATILSDSSNPGYIYGSDGYVFIDNINNPQKADIFKNGECIETVDFSNQITGFEYEVEKCINDISKGKKESEAVNHKLTLTVMKYMDTLRKSWNVIYPFE